MGKQKNSDNIDCRISKRRRIGIAERAEEKKSSSSPEEITQHCRQMFQGITLSEDFASLLKLTKPEALNFSLIQYRINAGIYGTSPALFDLDLQNMWNRVREIGQQMILNADDLSHISEATYEKHVGGFLHEQDEENNDNESQQMLSQSDKSQENETEDSSDSESSSDHGGKSYARHIKRDDQIQTRNSTQDSSKQEGKSMTRHKIRGDSQQMSIQYHESEEKETEDSSDSESSSDHGGKSYARHIKRDDQIQTRNSTQDSSKQEGKSMTRHKIRGDEIQSHNSREDASKEQDKSISHGNTGLHMTSERRQLRSHKNQSYNAQQNDQEDTSKEPKKSKTLDNRSLDKNNEKLKMHTDEIQSHNMQQIDQENTSEEQENSSARCENPQLHGDKQGQENYSASSEKPQLQGDNEGVVLEKKCCTCKIGRKEEDSLIECSNERCEYKFYHLRCLRPPLATAPPPKSVWLCSSCLCRVCFIDGKEELTLLCDGCDECYHIYCLNPPLTDLPKKRWFCPSCKENQKKVLKSAGGSKSSGSRVNSKKQTQLSMAGEGPSQQSKVERKM
ncbi:hypothetical protein SUGI_0892870 [Cryptomeria japonica]|nr:hypothetical protein SUGI_0892870 [Cryptomeria japonica]